MQSTLTHYDAPGAYYGSDGDDLNRYAALRQQALDVAAQHFMGAGTLRGLNVGEWFQLDNHPAHEDDAPEDRQFTVTGTTLKASNNLPGDLKQGLSGLLAMVSGTGVKTASDQDPPFSIQLQTQRYGLPLLPDFATTAKSKPSANGLQTALVVGPAGEEIHTDDQGRIKIQLHWQRAEEHPQSGAGMDDNSSCWVRVSMPGAGDGWGHQHIPRVGQEVLVQFVEGDIDRPVVTGVLYNGSHRNPAFSGTGSLPNNKVLSGFKSKEYKGTQYNELLFDDSTGEVRTRLSSEHGKTQLNMGFLTHPRTDGKADPRGEGFELRTDKHGAIRAAHGVLLSADAASNASGKQLDRSTASTALDAAYALAQSLGETATHQLADTPETGKDNQAITSDNAAGAKQKTGHQLHLKDAVHAWETGTNTAKGAAAQDQPGQQGLLILSAPEGIASATAQSMTVAAGTNLDITAQRDTNQTSGRRWLHNVGEHISLFVAGVANGIGMKLISAKGKIQLQAQSGTIEISAAKDVTLSAHDNIQIVAASEILLASGGAYIRLKGGKIEIHAPGEIDIKGTNHDLSGPAQMNPDNPAFPQSSPKTPLMLNVAQAPGTSGFGWAGMPYTLYADGAAIAKGVLDHSGQIPVDHQATNRVYKLQLANGVVYKIPVVPDYTDTDNGALANKGFHFHEAQPDANLLPPGDRAQHRSRYQDLLQPTPKDEA